MILSLHFKANLNLQISENVEKLKLNTLYNIKMHNMNHNDWFWFENILLYITYKRFEHKFI